MGEGVLMGLRSQIPRSAAGHRQPQANAIPFDARDHRAVSAGTAMRPKSQGLRATSCANESTATQGTGEHAPKSMDERCHLHYRSGDSTGCHTDSEAEGACDGPTETRSNRAVSRKGGRPASLDSSTLTSRGPDFSAALAKQNRAHGEESDALRRRRT
jgi:hypothetical protein